MYEIPTFEKRSRRRAATSSAGIWHDNVPTGYPKVTYQRQGRSLHALSESGKEQIRSTSSIFSRSIHDQAFDSSNLCSVLVRSVQLRCCYQFGSSLLRCARFSYLEHSLTSPFAKPVVGRCQTSQKYTQCKVPFDLMMRLNDASVQVLSEEDSLKSGLFHR